VIPQSVISNLVLSFREGTVRDLVVKSVDTKTKERFLLAEMTRGGQKIDFSWSLH
jgi:hypothetical protein